MTYNFADSFDLYATAADAANGYWDSSVGIANLSLVAPGRFTGQALHMSTGSLTPSLIKSSGVNDAVHHFVVSFRQTVALTGTTAGANIQLFDGATAQCSIVFRSDGAILLTSGGPSGTTLATYTGAVAVINTWYAFEFEVVINNTTGSFTVRKNGNTVNDFTLGSLNTRGGTANNYANKIQVGMFSTVNGQDFDDLFWQSGAATGTWLGDIRCYTRMPASDVQAQFARTATASTITQTVPTSAISTATGTGHAFYTQFTPQYSGAVTNAAVSMSSVSTSVNMKCAIFADNAGTPGAILAQATAPVNPVVAGTNAFTFSPSVSIVAGTPYWIGATTDGAGAFTATNTVSPVGAFGNSSYAAFPQNNPIVTSNTGPAQMSWTYTTATGNWMAVSEPQQDGLTSYVFDANPGDADFYGLAGTAGSPAYVIATTIRGYMTKPDAGTRVAGIQLKSGGLGGTFTPTTWNPADKSSNITLSNGNLTGTITSSVAGGARSIFSSTTGKYYFEASSTALAGTNEAVGLCTIGCTLASGTNAVEWLGPGTVWMNGSNVGNPGAWNNVGTVVAVAYDVGAQLVWFRTLLPSLGNWNGSGTANPATGAGGISFATIGGGTAIYPMFSFDQSGNNVTANFGASAFTGAVPAGFTSGVGAFAGATTVATPPSVLTPSGWQWAYRTDVVDPNTGAAWAPSSVNVALIGPTVVA